MSKKINEAELSFRKFEPARDLFLLKLRFPNHISGPVDVVSAKEFRNTWLARLREFKIVKNTSNLSLHSFGIMFTESQHCKGKYQGLLRPIRNESNTLVGYEFTEKGKQYIQHLNNNVQKIIGKIKNYSDLYGYKQSQPKMHQGLLQLQNKQHVQLQNKQHVQSQTAMIVELVKLAKKIGRQQSIELIEELISS